MIENSYSLVLDSSKTLSNSMSFAIMGDPHEYGDSMFDIVLVYVRENKVGAHLYSNPSNHIVVKMEVLIQPLKPIKMVTLKGIDMLT